MAFSDAFSETFSKAFSEAFLKAFSEAFSKTFSHAFSKTLRSGFRLAQPRERSLISLMQRTAATVRGGVKW